jgi:choline-sulfatase
MLKPNIVVIMSDQHNWRVMGNMDDPWIKTPNMDALAARGTQFRNAYTNCPVCVPARMSFLSGQLPLDHRCLINENTLDPQIPTYAHSCNIAGYQTVLAGRMHLYGLDQYRGHEIRLTGDNTPMFWGYDNLEKILNKDLKFTILQKRDGLIKSGKGFSVVQQYDDDVLCDAIDFLEHRTDDRPLMMTVGFVSPHPPYIARPELFEYYYNKLEDPIQEETFEQTLHPAIADWRRRRNVSDVSKEEWRRVRAAYYANVQDLDERVGKIMETVERTLKLDNTIVVYVSDHGDSIGINNLIWKTTFFDSSVKIPFIVAGPCIGENVIVDEPVCLNDLTRTILEYSGGPELPKPYGMSLRAVLESRGKLDPNRAIISQIGTYGKNPKDRDLPSAMIVKGRYKLISYHGYPRPSLFDLINDPSESSDLGSDCLYDVIAKDLLDELGKQWDGQQALEVCDNGFACFEIQKQWANTTKFKMVNTLYDTVHDKLSPAWDMRGIASYVAPPNRQKDEDRS